MSMIPSLRILTVAALIAIVIAGCRKSETESPAVPTTPDPQPEAPATIEDPVPPAAPGPRISFAARAHDFGAVLDVREYTCTFEFTNAGDRPLTIRDVKSNCGCATVSLEKTTYQPGEGSAIEVTYRPSGSGPQRKQIRVLSDSTTEPVVELAIVADVSVALIFDTLGIGQHELRVGEEHRETFRVWSHDPAMTVKSVGSRNPMVSLRLVGETEPMNEGWSPVYEIEMTLSDRAPWGSLNALLSVTAQGRFGAGDEMIEHTASIAFNASLYHELLSSETRFVVAIVPPGGSFRKVLRLTRREGAPFTVFSAEVLNSTVPGVEVELVNAVRAEGYAYELILTGSVGDYLGPIRGQVLVETDVPGEERRTYQFIGIVRE